ncbi:IS66 family transposase [Thioalkalivibrio sp. ALE20]|uniref:IS66 family transposase n=1 Tax=Thioalkalivibrio sp. ALE20 TaxID=545275 RepID=UPI0012EA2F2F|nr:IS66 family transposase [Thioalkalivibrio sp. ALE20]
MAEAASKLPDDPAELQAIIRRMTTEQTAREQHFEAEQTAREQRFEAELQARNEAIEQRDRKIEQLLERLELLRHQRFGPKADRIAKEQLALFDEAELNVLLEELDAQIDEAKTPRSPRTEPQQTPKRRPLPAHLPRVERILDLSAEEQAAIAETHVHIGLDESEQLGVLPKQYYVIRTQRAKYAPIDAEVPEAEKGLRIAPRPAQILPRAIGHSSLLAEVVTGKFIDGLPLYRQEKIFAREGIELSRQTLSGWLVQLATPLAPVMAALKPHLTRGPVLQVDETPVQVLDEPGRANTTKSYMWVYRGGPPDHPVVWFQYAASRAGEVPIEFLFPEGADPPPEHRFYLQTDGYAAYHALAEQDGIRGHMGCWAHVRRKAVEATKGRTRNGAAHALVALIGKLYAIERRLRGTSAEHRYAVRLAESKPILDEIKAWLDDKARKVLPKGLLGEAIQYTRKQWPILVTFLEDGHLEIDNNRAENAIRPFAVGRKAWLFSGSPKGAETSAMLYTLVETAKAAGLEPRAYLHYLFETLPTATTPDALEALLPHRLTPDDLKIPAPEL